MKLRCKKCGYATKISIFKHLPKEISCINCGNKIKLNNIYMKIYRIIDFCICLLLIVLFGYCSKYLSKIISIENIFLSKLVSYILSFCLFFFIYFFLSNLIYKLFVHFYNE